MTSESIRGPGELIAVIPLLIGFVPHESVVVTGLDDGGEVAVIMRVERGDLGVPDLVEPMMADVTATLRREGATKVILVSWTTDDVSLGCEALDVLTPRLEHDVKVLDSWATDGRTYGGPGCADQRCCPPGGRPIPQCTAIPMARVSRRIGHRPLPPSSDQRQQVRNIARVAQRWEKKLELGRDEWCERSWKEIRSHMEAPAGAPAWGKVLGGLQDVRVRDALIVSWLGASDEVISDVLHGRDTEGVDDVMSGALRPGTATIPEPSDLVSAREWVETLVTVATQRRRAVAHSLLAVLHWWNADLAGCEAETRRALACDPGYSLASLLADMCAYGLRPGWAQTRG
ncbi:DUF4192 domain-containing protein [Demequina sediminicola]|uniref:DUF4192 domain-containing protein n=1 Tax=Demequina sediminicola TaxID=1095026 RepID=UPI0013792951|nr:DUF4192 domain-containing protein [Demequina sediminicola]